MSDPRQAGIHLEHEWFARPVPENVTMGVRSWLHSSYAFLHSVSKSSQSVCIGHDTGVYRETHFELGPEGRVAIGDYCTMAGPIFATNGRVSIGNHVLISREVVFADHPFVVPPVDEAMADVRPPDTNVGNNVWIGTRAVILAGATIGDGAIIGAASIVDGDVPAYAIVAGNPARVVGRAEPRRITLPDQKSGSPP